MKAAPGWLMLTLFTSIACGGAGGRPMAADGPLPSGKAERRGLVLVEGEPEGAPSPPSSDGTTTPEIVRSVEADQP